MKYTPATIAKSLVSGIVAFVGAAAAGAHGADLSTLDVGDWLFALGSGVTAAGAVFATPNKQHAPAGDVEPEAPTPLIADVAIDAIKQTLQNAAHGMSELDRVKQAALDVAGVAPAVVGPTLGDLGPESWSLAEHVIASVADSVAAASGGDR